MKQAIALVLLTAMLAAALCGCAGTMPGTDGDVSTTDDGYVNGGDADRGTDNDWRMPEGRSGRPVPRPGTSR